MYLLEYFKEVPGAKRNETPKSQIMFDTNITSIRNVTVSIIFQKPIINFLINILFQKDVE